MGLRTWIYKKTGIRLKRFRQQSNESIEQENFLNHCKIHNIQFERVVHYSYFLRVGIGPRTKIGSHTYFNPGSELLHDSTIGRYCSVASGACLGLGAHPIDWLSTHPFQFNYTANSSSLCDPTKKKEYNPKVSVQIGNDVWIGRNAIISGNIIVGDGAIVASGSVVTKDVPPYAIVAGVPAKIIRFRFDAPTIQELLNLKWWNLEPHQMQNVDFDDIHKAIEQIKIIQTPA